MEVGDEDAETLEWTEDITWTNILIRILKIKARQTELKWSKIALLIESIFPPYRQTQERTKFQKVIKFNYDMYTECNNLSVKRK